jgi:signal transduction histidine kinase
MIYLLLALCILLIIARLLRSRSLRLLARQVSELGESAKHGTRPHLDTLDKPLSSLAKELSKLVDSYEGKLRKSRDMEKNVRLATSGLAHDLRTPLTSFIGYLQLLRNAPEEKRPEYLEALEQAALSLKELNESFYELARLEQDKNELVLERIDFREAAIRELAAYCNDFEQMGIELEIGESEEEIYINADSLALKRVLSNIIQNILRHAKLGAEISFGKSEGRVSVTFENDAENVPPDLDSIFLQFTTGDPSRSSKRTGLGLYICRDLVTAMGGHISARKTALGLAITISFKEA